MLRCFGVTFFSKALSTFIGEANDSRQRPDSRDHLNRTEYLPLLQRSLKFGLKTGVLSFFVFVFEILVYIDLAWGNISLSVVFLPLWLIVTGGILDGIICKTQHFLRVLCWLLICTAMIMTVLKVDYAMDAIRWRMIVSPVVALLSIISGTLIYIVYGHQIGYYQLTESQLTAGNLYSLAALICIVLFVVIGEVIPLSRPVEIETRIFIVVMAPLVVCLVGMGAWVVSRDEFGRLLLYGGQAAVHPMKLRWEADGWTSVQSKGVRIIPMFGEVRYVYEPFICFVLEGYRPLIPFLFFLLPPAPILVLVFDRLSKEIKLLTLTCVVATLAALDLHVVPGIHTRMKKGQ